MSGKEYDTSYFKSINESGIGMRNLPFLFHKKINTTRLKSIDNNSLAKKNSFKHFGHYTINTIFETGRKNETKQEENENTNININKSKEEKNISNNNNNSSSFTAGGSDNNNSAIEKDFLIPLIENANKEKKISHFFCLKNIFQLEDFHICGLVSGKGKNCHFFSGMLKDLLCEKFMDENSYLKADGIQEKPHDFSMNSDFVFYVLTLDSFIFIKKIFGEMPDIMKNKGINVEESGASVNIVILIKDEIISIKLGDIKTFFVYHSSSLNNNNNNNQSLIYHKNKNNNKNQNIKIA